MHVSLRMVDMRPERLTWHRRARRVEGTCATGEQRARCALSAPAVSAPQKRKDVRMGEEVVRAESGERGGSGGPVGRAAACRRLAHLQIPKVSPPYSRYAQIWPGSRRRKVGPEADLRHT